LGAKRLHLQAVNGIWIEEHCTMLRACGELALGRSVAYGGSGGVDGFVGV
jgi:hypothetical protein